MTEMMEVGMRSLGWSVAVLFVLLPAIVCIGLVPSARGDGGTPSPDGRALPPGLTRKVLPNGLTIILKENHAAPVLTMQAWCKAGSIHEDKLLGCGMSHFVEHMLFKGTDRRAVGQFAQEIKAAGGDLNAYTNYERTVFHIHIRSGFFDQGLDALSDVIRNSAFDPAETKKEQEVVIKELEANADDPDRQLYYLFNETAYQVHPYRFPVGGYVDQFRQLTREDLVAYYREQYVPGNLVFIVVGDFDTATALPKVEKAFADWKPRPVPTVYIPQEPRQLNRRDAVREIEGIATAKARWGWHTISLTHPDLYALDVCAIVLGSGRASRLSRAVKDRLGLVTEISAGSHTPLDAGIFSVDATLVDPSKFEAAEAAIFAEIERLQAEPVSAEELTRAKNIVAAQFQFNRQTVEDEAANLGSNEIVAHDILFDAKYVEGIRAVQAADLQRAARTWLVPESLTCTQIRPVGSGTASTTAGGGGAGLAIETKLYTLSNGMRLVVRRNPNLPLVSATAAFLAGVRVEPAGKNGVSNFMAQLLTRGTASRSADDIALAVESVGGALGATGGRNSFLVSTSMLKEHFGLGLELLADVIQRPAFAETEVEKLRVELISAVKESLEDVNRINGRRFARLLYGTHPYALAPEGTPESLAAIRREDILAYHRLCARPDNSVLAISGDVQPDEMRALVEKAFAGFAKGTEPLPAVPAVPAVTQAIREEGFKEGKQLGVAMLGFPSVSVKEADRYPLEVLASILTGLGGRLFEEVRGKQALAYNVGCFSNPQLDPGYFAFYVFTKLRSPISRRTGRRPRRWRSTSCTGSATTTAPATRNGSRRSPGRT
ncbi:MAG: insulinase family protein [Planctomycetes bacterium]|nr:insulinase family protein [Planctomycetota bacterium]